VSADAPHGSLISCLCLTRNRVTMLRRAISCFLGQTYRPRELVVLYQGDDTATREYLSALNEASIRPVEVAASPRLPVGSLRNLSFEAGDGRYVAIWDDDDWHGPTRLAEQVGAIHASGRPGCTLSRCVLYDVLTQCAFISALRTWEGTLVAERLAVPRYADQQKGSDTPVIRRMVAEKNLILLDRPDLYVYVCHGANTWDRQHWETNLLPFARRLGPESSERVRSLLVADAGKKAC
jgi:glycosyltransferase involved in cell wall biosynthesis